MAAPLMLRDGCLLTIASGAMITLVPVSSVSWWSISRRYSTSRPLSSEIAIRIKGANLFRTRCKIRNDGGDSTRAELFAST